MNQSHDLVVEPGSVVGDDESHDLCTKVVTKVSIISPTLGVIGCGGRRSGERKKRADSRG